MLMFLSSNLFPGKIEYFNIGASNMDVRNYFLGSRSYGSVIMSRMTYIPYSLFNNATIDFAEFQNATVVSSCAFQNASIKLINMPKVTTLQSYAFSSATLESFSMPNLNYIGSYAFANANISTSTLTFSNLIGIYSAAFTNLNGVSKIELPSLSYLYGSAFYNAPFETVRIKTAINLNYEGIFNSAKAVNIAFDKDIDIFYGMRQFSNAKSLTRVVFNGNIISASIY